MSMQSIWNSVLAASLAMVAAGSSDAIAATACADYRSPDQAIHCAALTRFDESRDLVGVRRKAGGFGFFLLSRSREPVAIQGRVVTARKGLIVLVANGELRLQSPAGTRTAFKLSDRLPRANTSGKEGAINSNGSRIAVFLRPPGSSPDADSDAVGLVDVRNRRMKTISTTEWKNPRWLSRDQFAVGNITVDARTGAVVSGS